MLTSGRRSGIGRSGRIGRGIVGRESFGRSIVGRLRAFRTDRRGVSAVEFALISPVLILLFVGMADLTSTLIAQRRASHATSSVGDLVAQFAAVDPNSDIPNAFSASADILAPYPTATLQTRISSIIQDSSGVARINWSCTPTTNQSIFAPYAAGTASSAFLYSWPSGLVANAGDSIIMVESTYVFASPMNYLNYAFGKNMTFNNVFYFKPRQAAEVQLSPNPTNPAYSYTPWVSSSTTNNYNYTSITSGVPSLNCKYQSG